MSTPGWICRPTTALLGDLYTGDDTYPLPPTHYFSPLGPDRPEDLLALGDAGFAFDALGTNALDRGEDVAPLLGLGDDGLRRVGGSAETLTDLENVIDRRGIDGNRGTQLADNAVCVGTRRDRRRVGTSEATAVVWDSLRIGHGSDGHRR